MVRRTVLEFHLAHLSCKDVRVVRMQDRPSRRVEIRVCPELMAVVTPDNHPPRVIALDLGSSLALRIIVFARRVAHYADSKWEATGMRRRVRVTS
jgi:hypothetical protein